MELEERREIIMTMSSAYPAMFDKKHENDSPKQRVKMWNNFLKDWDYEKTKKNLKKHIETSVFEPKVAEIKPKVKKKYGTFHIIREELEGGSNE